MIGIAALEGVLSKVISIYSGHSPNTSEDRSNVDDDNKWPHSKNNTIATIDTYVM